MRFPFLASAAVAIGFAAAAVAQPVTLSVAGNANLFGAGHATPPAPGGGGAGILPPGITIGLTTAPGRILTFSSVTGTIILDVGNGNHSNNPDGFGSASNTSVNSVLGVSGVSHDHAGFLAGVFLGPGEPADPAPARLLFSDAGGGGTIATNFTSLSPLLNQTFFIGDGLTANGSGAVQQFNVPVGASRLFFGITDAPGYIGNPGDYQDNSGAYSATFDLTPVPEPTSLALLGLPAVGWWIRRRNAVR